MISDTEKFAILYFLHSFVLSNVETVVIPRLHFDLVDSGRYKDFPWGSLSFEDLARSLNNRLKAGGQFYLIQGMPLAIQTIAPRLRFEFLMNAMFNGDGKKDATKHERSVDSDDDFQDPPPRKSNEHSKKKQKVDSSTPVVKKSLREKQVDSFEEHTQTRTSTPRAAKADGMKTPIFKSIPTQEVTVSKPESHVDKQAFISKKDFDAFRAEEQVEDIEANKATNIDEGELEQSGQHFSPDVVQSPDNIFDGTKTSDEKIDETILSDSQFTILDEMLPSLNVYQIQSIIIHPLANRLEESHHEILDANINRGITDLEVELDTTEQVRTPVNTQEVTNDEQRDEKLWRDSQNTIPPKLRIRRPSPYTEKFGSASERCIFLYDSYESSGHYAAVLAEIEKIAKIILLCLQVCDFYVKKGIDHQSHSRYKDKGSSDMFDVLFQNDLPQQSSGNL
ncbi:hypothetical protein FXO37_17951 [Capsicum annuum]|nr:hypothetical protein FXO37_17951 [Capsicum annuum]